MIYDVPLQVPSGAFTFHTLPLADGIRASRVSECPACAIIEYLAPSDPRVGHQFNPGVACLGHVLAQMWTRQAFAGVRHDVEPPIPWNHGVSHDDAIVYDGEHAGIYELKTHSEPKRKAPSEANRRQVRLRRRLRERAGLALPGPSVIVMIGKAGNETGWARGPYVVDLDDTQRAEIDDTLARIDHVMNRAATIDLQADADLKALSVCNQCFPKPSVYADAALDDLLQEYGRLAAEKREQAQLKDRFKEIARERGRRMEEIRQELAGRVPEGVVLEGITHNATKRGDGALVITRRRDAAA